MSQINSDILYLSLIGLAEHFRTRRPPKIRQALQCLNGILRILNQSPRIEARTLLQIGSTYKYYTKNLDIAKLHLEKALALALNQNQFEDVIGETVSLLASIYVEIGEIDAAKNVLWRGIERCRNHLFWQSRLLFQISELHVKQNDTDSACQYLNSGAEMCRSTNNFYTEALFLLSKALLLMTKKQFAGLNELFVRCQQIIDHFERISANDLNVASTSGSNTLPRKELLHSFFLALHVCYFVNLGRGKSASVHLKQLQSVAQSLTKKPDYTFACNNPVELFYWMPTDHLCILVYLLTVIDYMQCGSLDKALKYAENAHAQIEKLCKSPFFNSSTEPLILNLRIMIIEHTVMCRLIIGNNAMAIKEIALACQLLAPNADLLSLHRPQLHTLLGLYCMSMNLLNEAELQLSAALRITKSVDLWTFIGLNLSSMYLCSGREQDLLNLLERVGPERLQTQADSLKAAASYVKGAHMFCQRLYTDAKRYLRDTLALADKEDINRLSGCALVLLGYLFLITSNVRDSLNMVNPAMQVSRSIPDANIQLWGAGLLKDVYVACKDVAKQNECIIFQNTMSQMLLKDRCQSASFPEHQLITWLDGDPPTSFDSTKSDSAPGGEPTSNLLDF